MGWWTVQLWTLGNTTILSLESQGRPQTSTKVQTGNKFLKIEQQEEEEDGFFIVH